MIEALSPARPPDSIVDFALGSSVATDRQPVWPPNGALMRKAGAIALTIWGGLNLILASGILIALTALHRDAPALRILFHETSSGRLDPKALATVNALAVLCNACAAAFCVLLLYVTWSSLASGAGYIVRRLDTRLQRTRSSTWPPRSPN